MKKKIVHKTVVSGVFALAMMMTAAPVTAQAAGMKSLQAQEMGAILENCSQSELIKSFKQLGTNADCLKWIEVLFFQGCQDTPVIPEEPETPTEPILPEEPETSEPSQSENSFAVQVIELVNAERAKEGLNPLVYDAEMEQAALVRAKEIQTSFSHTRPDGSSFVTAMKEAGVSYQMAGENIAWGQKTPEQVVEAWMNSASHRANIMNVNYGRIGVGYQKNDGGVSYWVQLFAN